MALALLQALVRLRAREQDQEPPILVRKVEALFHYLDCLKGKFQRLAVGLMNGANAFSKLNPTLVLIVIYGILIYAVVFMASRFMMWIVMPLLDLAAGNYVFETLTGGLNKRFRRGFPVLNGLLGLLMGFSILLGWINIIVNINAYNRHCRIDSNEMTTLYRRSKMIRALPKGNYSSLRRISELDVNRNDSDSDSSSSSCAICLGCIGEEEQVRILPNCRHYFHIPCIDRWLLPCTVNNSSCPLCRATVISNGLHSSEAQ